MLMLMLMLVELLGWVFMVMVMLDEGAARVGDLDLLGWVS